MKLLNYKKDNKVCVGVKTKDGIVNLVYAAKHFQISVPDQMMELDLSPLARANDQNPALIDRFQLVVNGAVIINAYSELVDPLEQRRRLEAQAQLKNNGDLEAMEMDEDYLTAIEYGMPPISGWGFEIERLLMVLTDSVTIKDCVLFPLTRKL